MSQRLLRALDLRTQALELKVHDDNIPFALAAVDVPLHEQGEGTVRVESRRVHQRLPGKAAARPELFVRGVAAFPAGLQDSYGRRLGRGGVGQDQQQVAVLGNR